MNAAGFLIIAVGVFFMGAAIGLVAVVSLGIRHEERMFRERRSLAEEEGIWPGPHAPHQFFTDAAPDLVSHGARVLTGLWIRRERGADPLVVPWYERRP